MKSIKISPHNIQGQPAPIILQLNDSDLFYLKAKKALSEKLKGIPPDEFVFYYKSKQIILHEDDRVAKYFKVLCRLQLKNEPGEVELYLTSDLVKKLQTGGNAQAQQSQVINQPLGIVDTEKIEKLENELKKIKQDSLKLENHKKIEIAELNSIIDDLKQNIADMAQNLNDERNDFENKIKREEEQRSQSIEKYKAEMQQSHNLKIQIMQEQQKCQDLADKLKEMQKEKEFLEQLQQRSQFSVNKPQSGIQDSQLQSLKFELETLERKYQEEQFLKRKEIEKNNQMNKQMVELQSRINQKVEELNVARCAAEGDITSLNEQIRNLESKCESLRNTISSLKNEKKQIMEEKQILEDTLYQEKQDSERAKRQYQNLQSQLQEQEQEIQKKDKKIEEIKNQKDKEINSQTKQDEARLQEIAEYRQKEKKLLQLNKQQEYEIKDLQTAGDNLREQIQNLQNIIKKKQEDNEVAQKRLFSELDKEKEKTSAAEQKRIQLANRVKQNAVRKMGEGKVISATEALLKNMANPFDFLKNENIMTNDLEVTVEIIKIDVGKALESLTKNQDPEISKYTVREPVGTWRGKRSININGDGSKRKGFLLEVQSSDGDRFNNQVYVIKELVGYERISTVEKAMIVAQNHQIAKVLAILFQDKLKKASPEKLPCVFSYPDQYLLLQDGNYFIAERMVKGKFSKFNGEGESPDRDMKIAAFTNAFSLFTFQVTQQMLMVSNIQGIHDGSEIICYDPIISSPEGILGEEDLSEPHILQFAQNYKENPKNYGKSYLNLLGFKI